VIVTFEDIFAFIKLSLGNPKTNYSDIPLYIIKKRLSLSSPKCFQNGLCFFKIAKFP